VEIGTRINLLLPQEQKKRRAAERGWRSTSNLRKRGRKSSSTTTTMTSPGVPAHRTVAGKGLTGRRQGASEYDKGQHRKRTGERILREYC